MIKKSPAGSFDSTESDEPVGTNLSVVGDRKRSGDLESTPAPNNCDVIAAACAGIPSTKHIHN